MEPWQALLMAGIGLVLILAITVRSAVTKRRKLKEQDFSRKLETVLKSKEEVKVVCNDKSGAWILTNQRFLLETKEGFTAVPFHKIKSLSGVTAEGKKPTSPKKMVTLTIKGEKEYTLYNSSEEFVELATQLKAKTRKKKK